MEPVLLAITQLLKMVYYFSVFTQDDLGNTSDPVTLNYPTSRWATAIENTQAEQTAVKIIRNGQLLIFKGNKTYNILGAEM